MTETEGILEEEEEEMQKQIEKKEITAALKHSQSVLEKKSSNQTYC